MTKFRLTGVENSELRPGFKRDVTVQGIEDGKLLLVQVGQKLNALSPRCTHYGAPLVKGVLTASGRLTCPWHGACFNVKTGDIEDAPGLDSLHSFPVIVDDEGLFIEAEESQIKGGRRVPTYACENATQNESVLIVGGGSGAIGAIEGLRQYGYRGKIIVLSKEPYPPIDRTKLSKALITDSSKIVLRNADFLKNLDVELHTSTTVSSVDFDKHTVQTEDGQSFEYKKLLLATGATPRKLPMKGFRELGNVFVIRTIEDSKAIVDAVGLEGGKRIAVVGSSFIGMEVANFLVGKKHHVTIIGMEEAPLERVMGKDVGKSFQAILEKKGVVFYMGASVEDAIPSESEPMVVGSLSLKDGTSLEVDAIIQGVGVAPATSFLEPSLLEKDGSLLVDENFQIKGVPDAYAVGDIATYPYRGPGSSPDSLARIEHWNVAQQAARSSAFHIVTGETADFFTPIFWSALGMQLRYCGNTGGGYDDVVIQGNLEESKFIAFYTKAETVVAVAAMQKDPLPMHCAELMKRGCMPSKTEIQNGIDILSIDVPAKPLSM